MFFNFQKTLISKKPRCNNELHNACTCSHYYTNFNTKPTGGTHRENRPPYVSFVCTRHCICNNSRFNCCSIVVGAVPETLF